MPESVSNEELRQGRDLAAAVYLTAYIRLMARELGVDELDDEAVRAMALEMIDSLNLGTQAAWCALMNDRPGMGKALRRLGTAVRSIGP